MAFAARTKAATALVTTEELDPIGEDVFKERYAFFGNAFCALGLSDAFIVVCNVTMRKTAEDDRKLVTIVLNFNVTEIWVRGRKGGYDAVGAS